MGWTWCFITIYPCKINTIWNSKHPIEWYNWALISKSEYHLIILISFIFSFQGIYGYPIEIQALFFMSLRCALLMLKHDAEGKEFVERIIKRLHALSYHMRSYFWLDFQQLNDIYRYKTEEYSHTAVNKFNVIPDSIPDWVFDFMPCRGGYFIGIKWFCGIYYAWIQPYYGTKYTHFCRVHHLVSSLLHIVWLI